MSTLRLAAAAALCLAAPAALAQTGDLCENSILVGEGTTPFNSTGFGTQMTVPCAPSSADIFFFYEPTVSGLATIDTCGSSFDTVLAEHIDCFHIGACNDDSACGLQSSITIPVFEGISVGIRVATFGTGAGGPGVLNINVPPPAQWDENVHGFGDAGDLPATAQVPTGTNPFTQIGGTFTAPGDADLYLIDICDLANFSATTVGGPDAGMDTRLYLFTTSGQGVSFNDDVPAGFPGDATLLSRVSNLHVTTPGQYYLAVTMYDNAPQTSTPANIWNETPFDTERAPDGPGAASALASWTGDGFDTGAYLVTLTGACFATTGPVCDGIDFNNDGLFPDTADIDDFLSVFSGGPCSTNPVPGCNDIDFNNDGLFPDTTDIDSMLSVFSGGACL
jgi:hypothetical protein